MMRTFKLSAIVVVFTCLLLVSGCDEELQDLRIQKDAQQKKIDELQAELEANKMEIEQMKEQLDEKQDMIASLQQSTGESASDKEVSMEKEMDKVSYVIGAQMAQNFIKQGYGLDFELLILGITEVAAGKELAFNKEESKKVLDNFSQKMREKQAAERAKQAAENLAEGQAFLEANKTKEGVQVLPSGLQYKIIEEGSGETPAAEDIVKTHYRGTLINGTEFDSSYKRNKPAEFAVNRVIKGWTEALQHMKVGSKWELYIPANLAYGERGRPTIPPNSTLVFEIELLEIVKAAEPVAEPTAEAVK